MTDHAHHRPPSQREVNDHFDERAVTWHTEQRHVDNARLAKSIEEAAVFFGIANPPKPEQVFDPSFLPDAADRKVF